MLVVLLVTNVTAPEHASLGQATLSRGCAITDSERGTLSFHLNVVCGVPNK